MGKKIKKYCDKNEAIIRIRVVIKELQQLYFPNKSGIQNGWHCDSCPLMIKELFYPDDNNPFPKLSSFDFDIKSIDPTGFHYTAIVSDHDEGVSNTQYIVEPLDIEFNYQKRRLAWSIINNALEERFLKEKIKNC